MQILEALMFSLPFRDFPFHVLSLRSATLSFTEKNTIIFMKLEIHVARCGDTFRKNFGEPPLHFQSFRNK